MASLTRAVQGIGKAVEKLDAVLLTHAHTGGVDEAIRRARTAGCS